MSMLRRTQALARPRYWRAGDGVGAGNVEPVVAGAAAAGAAADFCAFGFFGRMCLIAFGGGAAGCSSATTGFGSMTTGGELLKSPVLRITCTGTVTGRYRSIVKVTLKPASGAGTETEQGVLQAAPREVVASAPGGTDSS